jgi:transcriptional regulator with XRE-family HTH domain
VWRHHNAGRTGPLDSDKGQTVNTDNPAPADEDVGRNLRRRRKILGLTLMQVAERTGLSATFISQVERGRYRPSVPTLHRLADAMGTNAYSLMVPYSESSTRIEINRAAERSRYAQEDTVPTSQAMPLISMGNQLQVIEVSGGPLGWEGPFVHRNDEFMYVITGDIEVELDGVRDELSEGDSLLYSGGVTLRWRALHAQTRVIVVIVDDSLNAAP